MIVWREKKGHRNQQPAVARCNFRRSDNEDMVGTASTITDKGPNYQGFTTLNEGNLTCKSSRFYSFSLIRALRAHEDSIYML